MKNIFIVTLLIVASSACGKRQSETTYAPAAVSHEWSTTALSDEMAVSELEPFCGTGKEAYMEKIFNTVFFQSGYLQHFDGSGYQFNVEKRQSPSGSVSYHRGDDGEMFSNNGMLMLPPSQEANLADLISGECNVIRRSLEGSGGYTAIKQGVGRVSGTAAYGEVEDNQCIIFAMSHQQFRHEHWAAFCDNAFVYSYTANGSGAPSRVDAIIKGG